MKINQTNTSNILSLSLKELSRTSFKAFSCDDDCLYLSNDYLNKRKAFQLKVEGNKYFKKNKYKNAINLYKRAVELNPDFVDAYYNLATSYKNIGQAENAIDAYYEIIRIDPNDLEARTYLGENLLNLGKYEEADKQLKAVIENDSKYDLASRMLKKSKNKQLALTDPIKAMQEKNAYAENNLKTAVQMVKDSLPEDITKKLDGIDFVFAKTQSVNGHQNIAQYENINKRITITDNYTWAAPEVIGSYVAHEAIHASDSDPYTSIKEEQDAYRASVKFWIANNKGYKDPEMDYATKLYLEDPEKLNTKVEEIYKLRDASIPKYSPYHGKNSKSNFMLKIKMGAKNLFSSGENLATRPILDEVSLLSTLCR